MGKWVFARRLIFAQAGNSHILPLDSEGVVADLSESWLIERKIVAAPFEGEQGSLESRRQNLVSPTSLHPFWSAAALTLTGMLAWGISMADEPEQLPYAASSQAASGRVVEWPTKQTKRPQAVIYDHQVNSGDYWTFEPIPEGENLSARRNSERLSLPVVRPVVWEEMPQSLVNPWEPWTWNELYEPIVEAPEFAVDFPEPKIEPIPDPFGNSTNLLQEMRGQIGSVIAGSSFDAEEHTDEFAEMVRKAEQESVVAMAKPKVPAPHIYPGYSSCGFAYQHAPVVVPAPRAASAACCCGESCQCQANCACGESCQCGQNCGCTMAMPHHPVPQYPLSVPSYEVMLTPEPPSSPQKVAQLRDGSRHLDAMAFDFELAGLYEQADQLRAVAQSMRVAARELMETRQSRGNSVAELQPLPPMPIRSEPLPPKHPPIEPVKCEEFEPIEMEEILLPVEFPSQQEVQEITRWFDWLSDCYHHLHDEYETERHAQLHPAPRHLPRQPVVATVSFVESDGANYFDTQFDLNARIRKMQQKSEELREYFDALGTLVDYGIPAQFEFSAPPPAEAASTEDDPAWAPLIRK